MAQTPRPEQVDWPAVARAIEGHREEQTTSSGVLANAESLSALFTDDFGTARKRVGSALELEPLNPVHTLRLGLVYLRFGAVDQSLAVFQTLQESLPGHPLPIYLRALATLRQDEPKRAANILGELIAARPGFVPGRFLQVEAQLRYQFKGLKKLLAGLPKGAPHQTAWAHLVVAMAFSGSAEGEAVAAELLENPAFLPKGSREHALAARAVSLQSADLTTLERALAEVPQGSKAEELVILLIHDKLLADGSLESAVEGFRRLHQRFQARAGVRRVFVAVLTRLAMQLSAEEQYPEALRLVERALLLEPHQAIHYQNRAALFTLMREADAYHDAWFDLNRHNYRLALLGQIDPARAETISKPHRLFAQQARMPAEPRKGRRLNPGFLIEAPRKDGGGDDWIVTINQERSDADPDLIRAWIHHRQAELVFAHRALGDDPRRFLLDPDDVRIAEARCKGLIGLTQALAVLVPDEGRMLADRLARFWTSRSRSVDAAYSAPPEDLDARKLRETHLETFGDLALLCLTWKPDGLRPSISEDLITFLHNEGPFFDEAVLHETIHRRGGETGYPIKILARFIDDTLGLDNARFNPLTPRQRAQVVERLEAELLVRLACSCYDALRGSADAACSALRFVERARKLDPGNPRKDLLATRFLVLSGYDEEARTLLTDLQRTARSRDPEIHSEIEELRKILDDRGKRLSGRARQIDPIDEVSAARVRGGTTELEKEVEQFPTSILAYEELARRLASEGRFAEAADWAERAIAQCLGREGQVRARSLSMEVLGLLALAARDQSAVRLYLTGAHRPAIEIIESIPETEAIDYTLRYLLGNARLSVGRAEDARRAFELALNDCTRQLHRTVLRGLANDVDRAYLLVARRSIDALLESGSYEESLREALAMSSRLRVPDGGLYDLARVHVETAAARLGTEHEPLPSPSSQDLARFDAKVVSAFVGDDLDRALQLATLAGDRDETCRRSAELVARKARALAEQAAVAKILARSAALLRAGKFAEALEALADAGSDEPRVVRQRALLLLKLDRFAEADAEAAQLERSPAPVAREFTSSYPALSFRQRIATATRMLRAGLAEQALGVLEEAPAVSPEDVVDLAYCRGFGMTLAFHRLRREGRAAESRTRLDEAIGCVEPHVPTARKLGHTRLLELYETLDNELSRA